MAHRRRFSPLVHASLALITTALVACPAAAQPRPNIVVLFSDDHAAHAISAYRPHLAYGGRFPETPQLDRLAAAGMLFQNAFVTNSICGPRSQQEAGRPFLLMLHFNAPHRFWDPGPEQLDMYRDTTFAEPPTFWDDAAGRASPARDPEMKVGLDLFPRDLKLEGPAGLTPAQRAAWDAAYEPENRAFRAAAPSGDDLARWRYQRYIADYARVVSALDTNVGRVLDFLDENGLAANTIVVYASDQGFFLGDHGWFDKRWMYEESLRMPLLVRWPGAVAPGSVNRDLVMNLDLAETFLDLAGAPIPAGMQGSSLRPLLAGRTPPGWRDAIYYQYFEYPGWHSVRRQYGVRTSRYKLIHYYELGEWELFDLERDPEELRSVFGSPAYAGVTADLTRRLAELRARYRVPEDDPVPYLPSDVAPEWRRDPPPAEHDH